MRSALFVLLCRNKKSHPAARMGFCTDKREENFVRHFQNLDVPWSSSAADKRDSNRTILQLFQFFRVPSQNFLFLCESGIEFRHFRFCLRSSPHNEICSVFLDLSKAQCAFPFPSLTPPHLFTSLTRTVPLPTNHILLSCQVDPRPEGLERNDWLSDFTIHELKLTSNWLLS